MELQDGTYDLVSGISIYDNVNEGFKDIDACILCGSKPRLEGQVRRDMIGINAKVFKEQGIALNEHAKKSVKVCVVANPCNTLALVIAMNAPSIPKENITAMTRLDENRSRNFLANKLNIHASVIDRVIILGNHGDTMFPFLDAVRIHGESVIL